MEVFQRYLDEFLYFFMICFLVAKSYRALAAGIKSLIVGVLLTLEKALESKFWAFLMIFDIFRAGYFDTTILYQQNQLTACIESVVRDIL